MFTNEELKERIIDLITRENNGRVIRFIFELLIRITTVDKENEDA